MNSHGVTSLKMGELQNSKFKNVLDAYYIVREPNEALQLVNLCNSSSYTLGQST